MRSAHTSGARGTHHAPVMDGVQAGKPQLREIRLQEPQADIEGNIPLVRK